MKSRVVCLAMLACLSMMFLAKVGSAQEVQPLEPDWLVKMYADGWQRVQEGVLRRDAGEDKIETFAYGAEGSQWVIERYRQQLTKLESEYRQSPADELASLIDQLTYKINSLQDDALAAPAAESFAEGQEGCSSYHLTADAAPMTSTQGVTASASAYFDSICEVTGDTYAYAYAKAGGETPLDQEEIDEQYSGAHLTSQAAASMDGSLECFSEAWSTTVLSTASTLTKTVCTTGYLNVKLTARDSASQTASATFTIPLYTSECYAGGPCP